LLSALIKEAAAMFYKLRNEANSGVPTKNRNGGFEETTTLKMRVKSFKISCQIKVYRSRG
jgi:hypothetical protein